MSPLYYVFTSPRAHHEGVDHGSQYSLQQQQHGAHWTLIGDDAVAVANRGLCLDGEEEGRDETIDIVDARRPRFIFQMVQITPWEERRRMCEKGKGEGGKVGVKRKK